MEVDEEPVNSSPAEDPQSPGELDPILMPVSETVDIVESRDESVGFTSTRDKDPFSVAADVAESMPSEADEPPRKKRGRPSKKQQAEGDDRRLSDSGSATNISAKNLPDASDANNDTEESKEVRTAPH